MPGRVVERGEVVVLELDLGPLDDPIAESGEDVLELPARRREQVQMARIEGVPGQGDVDRLLAQPDLELSRREVAGALVDQRLERAACVVAQLAERGAMLLGQ